MKKINSCLLALFSLVPICIGAESYLGGIPVHPSPLRGDTTLLSQPLPKKPAAAANGINLRRTRDYGDIAYDPTWTILPRWEIWEVGASKLDTMLIRKLPETGFQALTEQNAKWLVGPNYSCPSNHHAYIVKAVYRKGGAGQFRAERNGNKLVVVWADPMA